MPRAKRRPMPRTVPRLPLTKAEAAEALGMSLSHFERRVPAVGSLRLQRLAAFGSRSAGSTADR